MSEIPVISGSSTTVLCVQMVVSERKHSAGYMNFDNHTNFWSTTGCGNRSHITYTGLTWMRETVIDAI
jgi:hypothetical protein